ncbi:TNT domain-containing protein [Saccharopolyspora gloriosae]|uniref:TNT domain-containing protein n=1 Tax=Saccharopolyspora gloriosae TaxID=455344 RepID=UPI001FB64080|nr:TNT domain-containing protein [Saccharopolyspora gloriosae]
MILGTPIAGTYARTGGRLLPLLESRDGAAVLGGVDAPVPHEQVDAVLIVQGEAPEPERPFPASAAHGAPTNPAARPDVRAELAGLIERSSPEGWREVLVECGALGTRIEVVASVVTDGGRHTWIPPQELVDALQRSRAVEYRPEAGTWTMARCTAVAGQEPAFETGHAEVRWTHGEQDPQAAFDELCYFPRAQAPEWLLAQALRHYENYRDAQEPGGPVRMVRVFDGKDDDGRPWAHRPVLPWAEKQLLLEYLLDGRVVLSARGTSADEVDPQRPAQVPKQFHTDGTWAWPLAVAYYLEIHDITPPRDFLDHVRRNGHRCPEIIADHAAEQAKALVLGADPETMDGERTAGAINVARHHLSRLGVSRRFYSFTEPLEGGWSMLRDADGWWSVFCLDRGEERNKSRFPTAYAAAAHMIGAVALTSDSMQREPDESLADYECPIEPLEPDRPLSHYDDRSVVVLPEGAEVDRFGTADGNTVFVPGTTLPHRSVPPEEAPGEYHRYQVVRGYEVVTGVIKPDHGQVGGGRAYFLPQPVGDLIADGWLVEIQA